jgi:hypothetical protein
MARSVEDWGGRLERSPVKTTLQLGLSMIAVAAVLTAVTWGLATHFSYWWGQAGATQDKNSSTNFEQAQAQFHRDLNAIAADKVKIEQAQAVIDQFNHDHPSYQGNGTPYDPLAQELGNDRETLQGLEMGCQNEVSDYNTVAQSYLTMDWRDANLPAQLDPATACKP